MRTGYLATSLLCLLLLKFFYSTENLPFIATFGHSNSSPVWLFTSFRGNGEDGLHLAFSRDGYKWTALKNDQSFLAPVIGTKLMRDPCIVEGPDGTFHMVWTTGWNDDGFGYASSKDLVTWSEQKYIPVNREVKGAKNTWAPDLFYDEKTRQFLIVWATTIPGRFPETDAQDKYNHRLYYIATKDFQKFTEQKVFYNPGFNSIDGTLLKANGKYHLIFKDERPGQKNLRIAMADKAIGPYGAATEPISGDWVEGPSAAKVGDKWLIYFDHYHNPQYYGALESKDLKQWQEVSSKVSFPKGHRHGTVLQINEQVLNKLLAQ
jgi:beta-xylosidase